MLNYRVWWFYMEDKLVPNFLTKLKDKFSKNKTNNDVNSEYAFSTAELETISNQNKQKIQELKQDMFTKKKKKEPLKSNISEIIDIKEEKKVLSNENNIEPHLEQKEENKELKEVANTDNEETVLEEKKATNSFINLSEEYKEIVMTKWNNIAPIKIDKDIMEGKDLLNHNYTITYADDALKFIHKIRKEYEVVICYLIGFNNEKKGIYEKTIFSSKIDDEWRYLNQYIKILEKIRNFKK